MYTCISYLSSIRYTIREKKENIYVILSVNKTYVRPFYFVFNINYLIIIIIT